MAKGAFVSPTEERKILEIYARNTSMRAKEVLSRYVNDLSDERRVLSLRAVQRILGNARKSSDPLEDQEWAFHLMPTLGLPAFALPILTRLSRMQERVGSTLTCRDARWAWHVKSAAPELEDRDVLSIATQYSFEEWLYGRMDKKLGSDDDSIVWFLDKLITYKPWASDQNRREFVSDIPDRIPFPSQSLTWAIWAYCLGAPPSEDCTFNFESPHQVASMPPPPWHNTKEWYLEMEIIWDARVTDDPYPSSPALKPIIYQNTDVMHDLSMTDFIDDYR